MPKLGQKITTPFFINCCLILSALFLLLTISSGPDRSWAQGGLGDAYVGCFRDRSARDLDGYAKIVPDLTIEKCIDICRKEGFAYAGMQVGSRCFCGNSYGRYGRTNNCNKKCFGDNSQICGGPWANSVFSVGSAPPPIPPWQDKEARALINEWLRQVEKCARQVHPSCYIDRWGRMCGRLKTTTADCSMLPDHPPGWDNYHYLWHHNWCPLYFSFRVQDYVRRRQAGASARSLQRCKSGRNMPCR
jgi:hypothetical protein